MKKLVVLILALCMLCSVAFANELTWASVEESASQIAGEFKTFDEISVKIWIPEVLQAVELSDEDRESGYIGYFASDDAAVAVQYVNMEGMSLEEYEAQLKEDSEVSDIEAGTVNGLPALSYAIKDKDTGVVAFTTEMGYILEVACGPLSNEGFAQMVGIILSSIQGC
ncbi:MAG: hypothetical protein IJK71_12925 [Clostridia bacterium]|nr:hypothetical protein [Clostridia bacterium]